MTEFASIAAALLILTPETAGPENKHTAPLYGVETLINGIDAHGRISWGEPFNASGAFSSGGAGARPEEIARIVALEEKSNNLDTRVSTVEVESSTTKLRTDVLYSNSVKHPHHEIFESPNIPGTSYTFLARDTVPLENIVSISNGQLDLDANGNVIYLVTPWDSAGLSTWIWGLMYDEPTHDPACGKFYVATTSHAQIVRYDKCRYMAAVGATVTQLSTPPQLGTIGQSLDGWIRLPDLPANV